ncbi:MAG: S8 family serine peptidase, partial [Candidatus Aenigmatarchaeota archaeon]
MKSVPILLVISIVVALLLLSSGSESVQIIEGSRNIALKSREITPVMSSFLEEKHMIIQLDGIPDEETKKKLEERGIYLLEYLPENTWFASVSKMSVHELNSPDVKYVGSILPEDKLGFISGKKHSLIFFSDVERTEAEIIINKYGSVLEEPGNNNVWEVEVEENLISELLGEDSVKWVQSKPQLITHNDGSRAAIGVDIVQITPYGLNGTGIVVAEWDRGWAEDTHDGLADRVTRGDALGCGAASDTGVCGDIDHSTHVAGIMMSNGSGSNGLWGMAPNATLITYEWPDTYNELINETNQSVSNYSSVVSQNSWGYNVHSDCSYLGNYDIWSVYYDNITRGNDVDKAALFVFSAGNERSSGSDGSGDYYCGDPSKGSHTFNTTTGPGGTAKNTISVGAVTKAEAMTSFSSWGPTDDGRIKPDVVAAGQSVNSTFTGNVYGTSSGTSMAAPAVSGLVALIFEDFRNYLGIQNPYPSTVKALLIHTAKDLNHSGPDYTTGWGLVNATAAIDKLREDANGTDVIVEGNVSNGENDTYYIYTPPE